MRPALVVLAAGLSSRYGRLKQLERIGPAGESLLDFTIADAAVAGFGSVVVVVREPSVGEFRSHFEKYPPAIPVRLALQERDGRAAGADGVWKPWGTAHAVLSASTHLDGPFGVANADDHYGGGALGALVDWLGSGEGDAALIAFRLGGTLSSHGGVSRAVCDVAGGWLTALVEHTDVRLTRTGIIGRAGGVERRLDDATPVSMNLWGFRPSMASVLQLAFNDFRSTRANEPGAEFRLPDVVGAGIEAGDLQVRAVESPSTWTGLTFAADRESVVARLREAVEAGEYPRADGTGGE
jgi:hypothetical protein